MVHHHGGFGFGSCKRLRYKPAAMAKLPKLILWGGYFGDDNTPLRLEEIDSHASVSAYHYGEAFEKFFEVIRITRFARIADALEHPDAALLLSTFQRGFTKLRRRDRATFDRLQRLFRGRLTSISDFPVEGRGPTTWRPVYEDILFTVLPRANTLKQVLQRCLSPRTTFREGGWCASPHHCNPLPKNGRPFSIFLDHSSYADAGDYSHIYFEAISTVAAQDDIPTLRVFHQTNRGIEAWDPGEPLDYEKYLRTSKVPWHEIMRYYRQTDVFCVTHWGCAELSTVEAAMCGAKIYLPVLDTSFVPMSLMSQGIIYQKLDVNPASVVKALRRDILQGIDNQAIHEAAKHLNWDTASERIFRTAQRKGLFDH